MIAILGASGFVGARLFFDLAKKYSVVGTRYSSELFSNVLKKVDTTNVSDLKKFLDEINPQVIVNAANNPSSRWCNENPDKAKALNIDSTKILLESMDPEATLIYVSTMGAINPGNYYQETKRTSEELIKSAGVKYAILRPSIGFGVSPNRTRENISNQILNAVENSNPQSFDTSLVCQPTHLGHLSAVAEKVISGGILNATIPISVIEESSIYDIATAILANFGKTVVPINTHRPRFNSVNDVEETLLKYGLPTLSFEGFIARFTLEIKNREKYVLA